MKRKPLSTSVHSSLACLVLISAASTAAPRRVFPDARWEEATPESEGVDVTKLEAAIRQLTANVGSNGVQELVIVRHGRMIWKGDAIDRRHGVWSATKSFTSTVLGLLIEDGKCTLDTRVADVLPGLKDHYPDATLRHFTTMTSGYRAVGDETTGSYKHGPSGTPFQPNPKPLFAPPGSQYAYWDSAMNTLGLALTKIAGEPMKALFQRRIAEPIGMKTWDWGIYATVDGLVVNGGSGNGNKHLFITARELARFGLLFLNHGNWHGRQLVSARWVAEATRVQVPASLPWAHPESDIDGRGVYGFNWWRNGVKPDGTRKFPGAPQGMFWASGHNNNKCFVIPEWDMVVVRLGLDGQVKDAAWNEFFGKVGDAVSVGPKRPSSSASLLVAEALPAFPLNLGHDANEPEGPLAPLVKFTAPWTSPFRVDPGWPHHLVNREGEHLLILNKTAWAFFGCQDPGGYLDRARAQGANVIRVALEGRPYWKELSLELWPWGGTRAQPDWSSFHEAYWQCVEERVRLAGEKGIGLDVVLYFTLHPDAQDIASQRPYWEQTLRRLGRYANILTWEIANEYTRNEAFQDAAGRFFKAHDPQHRPVCTSDGTTDDALWPDKPWMDLAINHTCTSSTARHDLRDWYLAVAQNTRAHSKPAWCNESGRERRHQNDDAVHRRKQGWLWYGAGCFWTWHSWDGCEGINDRTYRAPGEAFLRPMVETFRALPFWRMNPNHTVAVMSDLTLVQAALATAERDCVLIYCCTRETGRAVPGTNISLRLPDGAYRLSVLKPADGATVESRTHVSKGLGQAATFALPPFTDDLAVRLERTQSANRTAVPGTH